MRKKNNIKFSVLMSVYKNDNPVYLKEALESIFEYQTIKPSEIVLVFDGPLTQELYEIIRVFQKDKEEILKIIELNENQGLGNALKIGSMHCQYEWIFRMDADDISAPNRFEKQIAYILENPNVDCVGSYISEFEQTIQERMRVRIVPETYNEIKKMAKRRNPMNHVSVCIKKNSLERCGGYEEVNLLEDYYLWLKMIGNGCRLENIPESLVYVRIGNGFHNKRGSKKRVIGWKQLQNYMIQQKMINKLEACINMVCINVFVRTPACAKKIIYAKIFRR